MSYTLGFIVGVITIAMICGIGSYYLWEKHSGDQHLGKKIFFAFFCFFSAGVLGLIGGIPALIISFGFAHAYRTKAQPVDDTPAEEIKQAS